MKLEALARELQCQVEGDASIEVTRVAPIESAGAGELSFVSEARYAEKARTTRAAALIVAQDFPPLTLPTLRAPDPHLAYAQAVALLTPPWRPAPGIDPRASIDATASLGAGAYVGPFAVIGPRCRVGAQAIIHAHAVLYADVTVGDHFVAHAHAVVREGTRIGHNVILQPGVVIGGDGFGFARRSDGSYAKIPQVGNVDIADDVEIQANSCIDRASLEVTRVRRGAKLDNLVHVAHNGDIGADVLLCAQVGLAGTTTIEQGAILAGQAGVAGHCVIGKRAIITAQSGTHGDLEGGKMYSGSPAFEHGQWLRSSALFPRLTEIYRSVEKLRSVVEALARHQGASTPTEVKA